MTLLTREDLWKAVNDGSLKMHYREHDLAVAQAQLRKVVEELENLWDNYKGEGGLTDMVVDWMESAKKEIV